jgi:hypothetical protein
MVGSQATANVVGEPANLLLYGPPGTCKTTDAVRAFTKDGRCTAFFIGCEDGALKTIAARGMAIPDHVKKPVKTWAEMQETIAWLGQNRDKYSAVIIDTISTLSQYLYRELEAQHSSSKNKFLTPTAMRNYLFFIREWVRMIGLHSVLIGHAMSPVVQEGVFYRGGPLLSPKTMIEQYYGLIDSVIRVDDLIVPGRAPMRVYYTGGNEWPTELGPLSQPQDLHQWRVKNREGCNAAVVPADLSAFLKSRNPPYAGLG